jgi:hypothetical protein
MSKSLAGNFDASYADAAAAAAAAARLSESELRTMLDLALKLAAENKITDRNVWSLPLIDHLPDMVHQAAPDPAAADAAAASADGGGTNYFTRISGGLDAGVQIYAKRVDATWKLVYAQLHGGPQLDDEGEGVGGGRQGGRGGAMGCGRAGRGGAVCATNQPTPMQPTLPLFAPPTPTHPDGQAADGSQDPGAAQDGKRRRRGGAEPREDDTLAEAAALRMKQLDGSFAVDPLFHRMSQIFDEDGAAGEQLVLVGWLVFWLV